MFPLPRIAQIHTLASKNIWHIYGIRTYRNSIFVHIFGCERNKYFLLMMMMMMIRGWSGLCMYLYNNINCVLCSPCYRFRHTTQTPNSTEIHLHKQTRTNKRTHKRTRTEHIQYTYTYIHAVFYIRDITTKISLIE